MQTISEWSSTDIAYIIFYYIVQKTEIPLAVIMRDIAEAKI